MRTLEEFAAIKSCPELFHFANSISDLLKPSLGSQGSLLLRAHSYPLLSDVEFEASSDDIASKTMTTATDDNIEILSCHVEQEDEEFSIPCQSSLVPFKLANGESLSDDRTISQRKRVVRAVGAVTFLLLLFSIILIGISLNMSKNIDEMVKTKSDNQQEAFQDMQLISTSTLGLPPSDRANEQRTSENVVLFGGTLLSSIAPKGNRCSFQITIPSECLLTECPICFLVRSTVKINDVISTEIKLISF